MKNVDADVISFLAVYTGNANCTYICCMQFYLGLILYQRS